MEAEPGILGAGRGHLFEHPALFAVDADVHAFDLDAAA